LGCEKDDAIREFLAENRGDADLKEVSVIEMLDELRTRKNVTAYYVPGEGIQRVIIHSSMRVVDDSTLIVDEEDASPAMILRIDIQPKRKNECTLRFPPGDIQEEKITPEQLRQVFANYSMACIKNKIARAIEEELYLPLKAEIERTPYTSRLGFLKEQLKMKIEKILEGEESRGANNV
jgi:hypothetical protein